MSNFAAVAEQKESLEVRVLARLWEQDGVWNVSAFDLPVVAFGKTLDEAKSSFEDAIDTHFEALQQIKRLETTVHQLAELASERDYYESRMTRKVMVEKFEFNPMVLWGSAFHRSSRSS